MGGQFCRTHSCSGDHRLKFSPTPLLGAFLIDLEPIEDERGFFARTICIEEFAEHGLNANFIQHSISKNRRVGTLRGMHFQVQPHGEEKLVRVTSGAVYDVIVDIRPDSATFGQWFGTELSADNHRQLYIPKGMAHGFQTLAQDTEVLYAMTTSFHPSAACGFRWDDSTLGISWPEADAGMIRTISDKDLALPLFSACFEKTFCKNA